MASDPFVGSIYSGLIAAAFLLVTNSIGMWAIARFRFRDKSWGTAFKVTGLTGLIGFIFGVISNDFPAPMGAFTGLFFNKPLGLFQLALAILYSIVFIFLIKYFYKIRFGPAALFGLPLIMVTTILAHLFMFAFFVVFTIYVWGGIF